MAYDAELEARVEALSLAWPGFARKKMFGGVGWLFQGNMAFGVVKDRLALRCGPERHAELLARPGAAPFGPAGRAMTGWLLLAPEVLATDADLLNWLEIGRDHAATLPAK